MNNKQHELLGKIIDSLDPYASEEKRGEGISNLQRYFLSLSVHEREGVKVHKSNNNIQNTPTKILFSNFVYRYKK